MTLAANDWHWSLTPRSQGAASRESSRRSCPGADGPEQLSATTGRNYQYGGAQMMPGDEDRLALHRARKADAEPFRGKLQRQLQRRTLERHPLLVTGRGPREDHSLEGGLQPPQTPLISRQPNAAGICIEIETGYQGRTRPETNRRIHPKAGGKWRLTSHQKFEAADTF